MPFGAFAKYGALKYKGEMLPRPLLPYTTELTKTEQILATEAIVIPVQDYPWFQESCIINNSLYQFEFQWSERGQYWTMSIMNDQGTHILSNVKLLINYEVFDRYSKSELPFGFLIPIDNQGSFNRIQDGDLGARVNLVYIPEVLDVPTI